MKTSIRKVLCAVLCLIMIAGLVPVQTVQADSLLSNTRYYGADFTTSTLLAQKLDQLFDLLPYGDYPYFTISGNTSCSDHNQYSPNNCQKCYNLNVAAQHPKLKTAGVQLSSSAGGWGCFGFAQYAFKYLFGVEPGQYGTQTQKEVNSVDRPSQIQSATAASVKQMLDSAKVGDLIQMYGSSGPHTAIFLQNETDGVIVIQCNYFSANYGNNRVTVSKISHSTIANSFGTKVSLYRCKNYSELYETPASTSATAFNKIVALNVLPYFQLDPSYCSAASAKTVLTYFGKASNVSEADLQKTTAKTSSGIKTALNTYLNGAYSMKDFGLNNSSAVYSAIESSLNSGYPVIGYIGFPSSKFPKTYFNYSSDGHFTTIVGIYTDSSGAKWLELRDSYVNRAASQTYCNKDTGAVFVPFSIFMQYLEYYSSKPSVELVYHAASSSAPAAPTNISGVWNYNSSTKLYDITITWKAVSGAVRYIAKYKNSQGGWDELEESNGQRGTITTNSVVAHDFSASRDSVDFCIIAVNASGIQSSPTYATIPKNTVTYTITYNANGGSNPPASQTKTHNTALTLSSTKPTRTGYTFQGWAESASATTAAYQPGGSFTKNANTTLYAVWKEIPLPTNLVGSTDKSTYLLGETVKFTMTANNAARYAMSIWDGGAYNQGNRVFNSSYSTTGTFTFTPTAAGTYGVRYQAENSAGKFINADGTFTVKQPTLSAAVNKDGSVTLNISYTEPNAAWYWKVSRSTDSSFANSVILSRPNGSLGSWTDTDAANSPNTTFYYKIQPLASNGSWTGGYSNVATVKTPTQSVPAVTVPTVKATASAGKNTVTWNALEGATRYRMYKRVYSGSAWGDWVLVSASLTGTSWTDTDVVGGTQYMYRMRALIGGTWYGYSNNATVTVPIVPAVTVPTVKATASAGKNTVTWNALEGATRYRMYKRVYSGSAWGDWVLVSASLTGTSWTDTDVKSGTQYMYRMRAYIDGGWYGYSNNATVTAVAPTVTVPTVSATAAAGQNTVTWDAIQGATRYRMYKRVHTGSHWEDWVLVSTNVKGTSWVDTDVTGGTTYMYRMRAYIDGGWYGYSNNATVTAIASVVTVPTVSATAAAGQNTVTWNAVDGATRYRMYRSVYSGSAWGDWELLDTNVKGASWTDVNVASGTKYMYRMRAYIDGSWYGYSNSATVTAK